MKSGICCSDYEGFPKIDPGRINKGQNFLCVSVDQYLPFGAAALFKTIPNSDNKWNDLNTFDLRQQDPAGTTPLKKLESKAIPSLSPDTLFDALALHLAIRGVAPVDRRFQRPDDVSFQLEQHNGGAAFRSFDNSRAVKFKFLSAGLKWFESYSKPPSVVGDIFAHFVAPDLALVSALPVTCPSAVT